MGEYSESHSVARLIGSPPGYVGYEEGGQLTEAVRRKPYSVVLFDEIEKAHPDVFKVFLEILDEGHLTDGKGRKVNFKNTIILMTSNAITNTPSGLSGRSSDSAALEERNQLMQELGKWFRPELLNRIDDIVVYQPLSELGVQSIAMNELAHVAERLQGQNIQVQFDPEVVEWIARIGYDPIYGARPLKRAINREILDVIATKLLSESSQEARIRIVLEGGKIAVKQV